MIISLVQLFEQTLIDWYVFIVYSLVTDQAVCDHESGKSLVRCKGNDVSSISDCQAACTSYQPCLGYMYTIETTSNEISCSLIPLSKTCPSVGYKLQLGSRQLAKTVNDIVPHDVPGSGTEIRHCYVKIWD